MLGAVADCAIIDTNGEVCGRKVVAHGLCGTHAARARKGQDLRAPIQAKGPGYGDPDAICPALDAEGNACDEPVHAHGFCSRHYQEWRRKGHIEPTRPKRTRAKKGTRSICQVEEDGEVCGRTDIAGESFCHKHYQRFQRYGDPTVTKYGRYGGGSIDAQGYRRISVNGKRLKEHRYIFEVGIGLEPGTLPSWIDVHHKDDDRTHNDFENLEPYVVHHPRGVPLEDIAKTLPDVLARWQKARERLARL